MDYANARLNKVCCRLYNLHKLCLVCLLIFAMKIFKKAWILRFPVVWPSYWLHLIVPCWIYCLHWFLYALIFSAVQAALEQTADELSTPISTIPMLNVLTTPVLNMPMAHAETIQVAETPPTSSIWRDHFDMLYL